MSTVIKTASEPSFQLDSAFDYGDEFGPEKIVYIYEPRCGLRGIVVIDNSSIGPAIGGIRMTPTVNTREVFRLARAMTWKNALAGIPHGGGKSGIIADPNERKRSSGNLPVASKHSINTFPAPIWERTKPQWLGSAMKFAAQWD
jgi:hypothetical protein